MSKLVPRFCADAVKSMSDDVDIDAISFRRQQVYPRSRAIAILSTLEASQPRQCAVSISR